jgi:hypothetical protein
MPEPRKRKKIQIIHVDHRVRDELRALQDLAALVRNLDALLERRFQLFAEREIARSGLQGVVTLDAVKRSVGDSSMEFTLRPTAAARKASKLYLG